jgi:tyrosyl-tRNA synthetase
MLAAESYRARLETGLNFIEFNYMLLQAYDFWHLYKHYDCRLQMGGNDQWGNILAGVDLTRRIEGETIHGLTFPLLTTSSGIKMGKTHEGAVWLDPKLTSPYDYYQYWINQEDSDVERFLALFTLLPMDKVKELGALKDSDIREAKEVLAYETTRLCHGKEEADLARQASRKLFGSEKLLSSDSDTPPAEITVESLPTCIMDPLRLEQGIPAYILFEKSGLCKTRGEARRLIAQGGGYLNDRRIQVFDQIITSKDMKNNSLLIRAGKKRYMNITIDRDSKQ